MGVGRETGERRVLIAHMGLNYGAWRMVQELIPNGMATLFIWGFLLFVQMGDFVLWFCVL